MIFWTLKYLSTSSPKIDSCINVYNFSSEISTFDMSRGNKGQLRFWSFNSGFYLEWRNFSQALIIWVNGVRRTNIAKFEHLYRQWLLEMAFHSIARIHNVPYGPITLSSEGVNVPLSLFNYHYFPVMFPTEGICLSAKCQHIFCRS